MDLEDLKEYEQTLVTKLMKWNQENSFLVMDLLRIYCLHRDSGA